jgi:hypothetical protein
MISDARACAVLKNFLRRGLFFFSTSYLAANAAIQQKPVFP